MRCRHPIPTTWLMTDERMGDGLWDALARLPDGSGVVVRHHSLPLAERRTLLAKVTKVLGSRGVVLGSGDLHGRDGIHNGRRTHGLLSRSVHNRREAVAARRAKADLVFVSPLFTTRSHPTARMLGRRAAAALVRDLSMPVIALGGMTAKRFKSLKSMKIHGWAGIDAWLDRKGAK